MKNAPAAPAARPRRRGLTLTALATAGVLTLAACTGGDPVPAEPADDAAAVPAGEVNPDGIIEAGISYTLSGGFDPMITTGAVTVAANWHTMEGLTELAVNGRIDGYWADHLDSSLAEVVREGQHRVRLDLSRATFISSAGIGVLMRYHKQLARLSGGERKRQ